MIEKFKYLVGNSTAHPVFVLGTGRSGTHWLGFTLEAHPEIHATIEERPAFTWSTEMALNPKSEERLYGLLVLIYKWQVFNSAPKLFLDKSHPNIWIAEKLKRSFPKALFVGIERNPYATVASMLKHRGVLDWQERWQEFPIPNRFLGISPELAESYATIPLAAQCAIRWQAHHIRMSELTEVLGDALMVISYEMFARNPAQSVADLQEFLKLSTPIPVPDVRQDSLDKWKEQLSAEEIEQIHNVVGFAPDEISE